MQLQRLNRLMSIISDIRHNPRSTPDELCARFAISRRQFYKDRDTLETLGYVFHFSRSQNRLLMDSQPQPAWDGLFSLCLAVQALLLKDDLNAVLRGLQTMRELLAGLAVARPQKLLAQALEQLIWEQGLGCGQAVLDELLKCISEGRRVVILLKEHDQHFLLDPQQVALFQGVAYLVSSMLPAAHQLACLLPVEGAQASQMKLGLALRHIRKVVPTPFYAI